MREPIFPGASRPPMKWGVPLMALVACFMPAFVLGVWLGVLVSWWAALLIATLAAPAFLWMRTVTARDDHRLAQQALRIRLFLRHPNRALRGDVRSYGPVRPRETHHARHR